MNEEYRKEFVENRKKMINEMDDADKAKMMKDFEMPSKEDLMKMVDSFKGITDEQREKLREQFLMRGDFQKRGDIPAQNVNAIDPATPFEVISLVLYLGMLLSFVCVFGKILLFDYLILINTECYSI